MFAFHSMPGIWLLNSHCFEMSGVSVQIDRLLLALQADACVLTTSLYQKRKKPQWLKNALFAKNTADRNRKLMVLFCRLTCALDFIIGSELPSYAEGCGWTSITSLLLASPPDHKRVHRCCKISRQAALRMEAGLLCCSLSLDFELGCLEQPGCVEHHPAWDGAGNGCWHPREC